MSSADFGWVLIAASVAIAAYCSLQQQSLQAKLVNPLRGRAGLLSVTAVVFLLVAGLGGASSYVMAPEPHAGQQDGNANVPSHGPGSHAEDEMIASLKNYTQALGSDQKIAGTLPAQPLADVDTMIARLAARLKDAPNDVKGWRMLGWSYFNMERYEEAATAYARAVTIDPDSVELKAQYDEAKSKAAEAKAAEANAAEAKPPATSPSVAKASPGQKPQGNGAELAAVTQTAPRHESSPDIQSMVDGLATRLKSSPRDAVGWMQLMRSRVVLGQETEAATALRDALDVFKDDSASSSQIAALATELGLKLE